MTRRIRAPILVFSRGDAAIASGPLVLIGSYRSSPCVAPFTDRRVDHSSFSGERAIGQRVLQFALQPLRAERFKIRVRG